MKSDRYGFLPYQRTASARGWEVGRQSAAHGSLSAGKQAALMVPMRIFWQSNTRKAGKNLFPDLPLLLLTGGQKAHYKWEALAEDSLRNSPTDVKHMLDSRGSSLPRSRFGHYWWAAPFSVSQRCILREKVTKRDVPDDDGYPCISRNSRHHGFWDKWRFIIDQMPAGRKWNHHTLGQAWAVRGRSSTVGSKNQKYFKLIYFHWLQSEALDWKTPRPRKEPEALLGQRARVSSSSRRKWRKMSS